MATPISAFGAAVNFPFVQNGVRLLASVRARYGARQTLIGVSAIGLAGALSCAFMLAWYLEGSAAPGARDSDFSSRAKRRTELYRPSEREWANLSVAPVTLHALESKHLTEGKIAIDEDRATPIFSPYAGRVTKLFAIPGEVVERGQELFTVEATDMVQAQNDFIAAATTLNKARSQLNLSQINDKRQRDLYEGKAVPLKEVQNARAALDTAENDVRSGEVALEAVRNRLRILGKTDQEITTFHDRGTINPATPIYAPIGGTVVLRKVGPGQYIGPGSSDPVFVIGDLRTVWLTAFVHETDATKIRVGQSIRFTVLSYKDRTFAATVDYVAATLDPNSRRLLIRATVDNSDLLLKPEMFASASIVISASGSMPAIPSNALVREGEKVRAWVVRDDNRIEARPIVTGLTDGTMTQVVQGLAVGEKVISGGSLFIDRIADAR